MKQASLAAQSTPKNKAEGNQYSLKNLIARGAVDWNFSQRAVIMVVLLPVFVCMSGAISALLGKPAFKLFTGEDGIAEYLQVLFWILSFVSCIFVGRRAWRSDDKMIASLYFLLLFGLFFLIGEELSWGQRIFGWETPASMEAINKQNETNLHNIYGVGDTFKWLTMVIGAYGTFLPLLFYFTSAFSGFKEKMEWLVPHYTMITSFGLLFIWRIYRNLFDPPEGFYFVVSEFSEVIELNLAIVFFLFMIYQLRRNLAM